MKNFKIDYICLPHGEALDGRGIYDMRFIEALREVGTDVNVVEVALQSNHNRRLPLWARGIASGWRQSLRGNAKTIVSHELLIPVVQDIRPDLFIIHNFAPSFKWPLEIPYSAYYKFCSESYFLRAIHAADRTMVLSRREQAEIYERFGLIVDCEPPGVRLLGDSVPSLNLKKVRRSGTVGWYPKRRCVMRDRSIRQWFGDDAVTVGVTESERCFSVIEDKFAVGFKLKLLDSLYYGDFVVSRVDLRDEIMGLGLSDDGFCFHNESITTQSLRDRFLNELSDDFVESRRRYLVERFSWSAIVTRTLQSLT